MTSQYTSTYPPGLPFNQKYKTFIEEFYRISDTPDAHEAYLAQFSPNARLVMASKEANGPEEILALRKALWTKISSRSHRPVKVYPFGAESDEVMIFGSVEYDFREEFGGGSGGLEWAARGVLGEEGGKVVWKDYQVFLDTAAQVAKK